MLQHSYTVVIQAWRAPMSASLQMLVLLFVATFGTGCHVMISNEGEWSRPVVLPKTPGMLEGAKVALNCGVGDFDGDDWGPAKVAGCKHLDSILTNMGASIVERYGGARLSKREQEEEEGDEASADGGARPAADFQVVYIDRSNTRDYCGWTLVPFVLSFTLFPCIEDVTSRAELQFLNGYGDVVDSFGFHADSTIIYGPLAMYYWGIEAIDRPEPRQVRTARRQTYFVEFVKSRIISYWTRLQLQRKTKRGAAT